MARVDRAKFLPISANKLGFFPRFLFPFPSFSFPPCLSMASAQLLPAAQYSLSLLGDIGAPGLRLPPAAQVCSLHASSAPPVLHFSRSPVLHFSVLAFSHSPPALWPLLICSAGGVVVAARVLTSSIPHFLHLQVVLLTPLPFFSLFI